MAARSHLAAVFVLASLTAACGGASSRAARPAEGTPAAHGEVCSSEGLTRACAAGLVCAYPCGIEGCDSVCTTPEEAERWTMLPKASSR